MKEEEEKRNQVLEEPIDPEENPFAAAADELPSWAA